MKGIYPWQKQQWENLVSQKKQNRLPHAILFSGISGLGKKEFAWNFAKTLLCEDQSDSRLVSQIHDDLQEFPRKLGTTASFCNHCRSCQWMQSQHHPDCYSITIEEKSQFIKVSQIRQLIRQLSQTAQYAGYQIAFIPNADKMNREAANALLKTLEEPFGQVIFMLTASQINLIPPTIMSRCQLVHFKTTHQTEMKHWLKERINTEVNVERLLKLSEWAPLRALEIVQSGDFHLYDQLVTALCDRVENKNNVIDSVSQWLKQNVKFILHCWLSIANDIARLQLKVNPHFLTHEKGVEVLNFFANTISPMELQKFIEELIESKRLLEVSASMNVQLLLENLLIEWEKITYAN